MRIFEINRYFIFALLLFFISIHIKVDNIITLYPFRFLVPTLAVLSLIVFVKKTFFEKSISIKKNYLFFILLYLLIYPSIQSIAYGQLGRPLKDCIYLSTQWSISIVITLFFITTIKGISKLYLYSSIFAILTLPSIYFLEKFLANQVPFGIDLTSSFDGRIYGLMGTPTHLAHLLLFSSLLSIYIFSKNTSLFYQILLFVLTFLCSSRMNLIILSIFFILRFIFYRNNLKNLFIVNKNVLKVLSFFAVVTIIYLIFDPSLILRALRTSDAVLYERNTLIQSAEISRLASFKMGFDAISSFDFLTFLFGVGAGGERLSTFNAFLHVTYYFGFIYTCLASFLFLIVFQNSKNLMEKFILFSFLFINMVLPVFFDDKFNYSIPIFMFFLVETIFSRNFKNEKILTH